MVDVQRTMEVSSKVLLEVSPIEPSDLLISSPELASFVDINLASLLSIRLPELLPNGQSPQTSLEDPSFAAKIGGAR